MTWFRMSRNGTTTAERGESQDDYVIVMDRNTKKKCGLGGFGVVKRIHPTPESRCAALSLQVHCRVLEGDTRETGAESKPESAHPAGYPVVKLDQTLRNALGIPHGYDHETHPYLVQIFPLDLCHYQWVKWWASRLFGRRYLFLRVVPAHVSEMEKDVCRIPAEAFPLLGIDHWGNVVVERPDEYMSEGKIRYKLKSISVKAAPISPEVLKEREKLQVRWWDARYPDCMALLRIQPDIWSVFVDAHLREKLGYPAADSADSRSAFCTPVKVRRDLWDVFFNQILQFGLVLGVTFIACLFTVSGPKNQWSYIIPSLLLSVWLAIGATLARIKAMIRGGVGRLMAAWAALAALILLVWYYILPATTSASFGVCLHSLIQGF